MIPGVVAAAFHPALSSPGVAPPWVRVPAGTYVSGFDLPNARQVTWVMRLRKPADAVFKGAEQYYFANLRSWGDPDENALLLDIFTSAFEGIFSGNVPGFRWHPGEEMALMLAIDVAGGLSGGASVRLWINGAERVVATQTRANPVGYDFGWSRGNVLFNSPDLSFPAGPVEAQAVWISTDAALDPATHWGQFFGAGNELIPPAAETGAVAGFLPTTYIAGDAALWNSGVGIVDSFTVTGDPITDAGPAGPPVLVNEGVALWGDSMAGDASGGGGIDQYLSGPATLARYLVAAGLPAIVVHNGLSGSAWSYTRDAWEARAERYRYNVIDCGRNHDWSLSATVGELTGFAEALIADKLSDEVLIFVSVQNTSGEGTGGANLANILSYNAALAALADGEGVFYVDTRGALVVSGLVGDTDDQAAAAANIPPPSLLADGLHRNTLGTEISARMRFRAIYDHWTTLHPRGNLIAGGSFPDLAAWNVSGSWSASGGVATGTGAEPWKSISQQVLTSGAAGKRYLVRWDYPSYAGNIAFKPRPFTGGGSNYAAPSGFSSAFCDPPLPFNPGPRRAGPAFTTFIEATGDQLALLWEAQSDAAATFGIANVIAHEVPA